MEMELRMKSKCIADENYAMLSKMFPNAVTERIVGYDENGNAVIERAIDADVLRQEISCSVVEGNDERYQFTWPDKKKSILLANAPVVATLRPCKEESVDFDNTGNLYIEGDNLDVLKLLQETYLGKVKIIYIDPPYNTGNDFIYEDDFTERIKDYVEHSGQYDGDGNRLVKNVDSNGRFHTDWLNMMYSRLKLAKNLLADDGVIFISIDDNEMENLRKICSEIFGASNYVNHFAWICNITGRQISGKGAAKTWESILVYAKDINMISEFNINISFAKNKMPDTYKGFNKDIRRDDIGEFAVGDTLYNHNRKFNEETRPNLVFSIFYNPVTEEIVPGEIGEVKVGFVELLPHANGDGTHKATMIVEHISYDQIEGKYDSSIFTAEKHASFDKAYRAKKHIQDYVFTDGTAEKSVERRFAEELDGAKEVCVYAKLPKGFAIPTPVGSYSPDWAIAFYEGTVKHIYFIAETKGTMESLELRPIEKAKISCARKLFNEISTENVVYHDVDSYQNLLNIMNSIEK